MISWCSRYIFVWPPVYTDQVDYGSIATTFDNCAMVDVREGNKNKNRQIFYMPACGESPGDVLESNRVCL